MSALALASHLAGAFVFSVGGTLLVVRAPKQNCPRCNAQQSFRPRTRDTVTPEGKETGSPAVVEVFIKCTTCQWEHVLRQSTLEIERLMKIETRLLLMAEQDRTRLGVVRGSTRRLLSNLQARVKLERGVAGL